MYVSINWLRAYTVIPRAGLSGLCVSSCFVWDGMGWDGHATTTTTTATPREYLPPFAFADYMSFIYLVPQRIRAQEIQSETEDWGH